jgi:flagellar basal body-associated protein FliL
MKNETQNKSKKFSREYIITMLMIFLISAASAALVIHFRIKMKPYQIKPAAVEESNELKNADKNAPQNVIK